MAEKKYELIKESKITESREIGTDLSHLTKYNEYDKDRGEYVSYYKPEDIRKERKKLKEKRKALKKDECEYEDIFNTSNFVKPKLLEETYNLYRIRALKDFGNVKTGYLGGYVEKEENLSHEGNCWVDDNAKVYNNAKISGNAEVYDNAKIYGEADVFGNAKVYGNAEVYNKTSVCDNAMVYDNAKVSDWVKVYNDAQVYGEAKVYNFTKIGGEAKVYDNAKVYDYADVRDKAKVYGNAEVSKKTKMYGFTEVGGDIKIIDNVEVKENSENETKKYELTENTILIYLENEIQKYEEHCSKIVDKLKLQDELPNFQVISQKGVLYEKNSENNNISEIKNFVENLKGEEFWDNMSLKDIRNWKELRNDEVVSIVYESKDDRDNITLEEFTDYNDYAKDTVKNALEKEFKNNPDTIESLKKDILDKVPNKEVVKEKVEVVKDIEKEHLEKEEKVTNKTFGYRSDF